MLTDVPPEAILVDVGAMYPPGMEGTGLPFARPIPLRMVIVKRRVISKTRSAFGWWGHWVK